MESESFSIPEIKPKDIVLNSENVNRIFNAVVKKENAQGICISGWNINISDPVVFDEESLIKNWPNILALAVQLPSDFYQKSTGGADYHKASLNQNGERWTNDWQDVKNMLTMINAINLGYVTTPNAVRNYSRVKNKDEIYFFIKNPSDYIKELQHQYDTYGHISFR